MHSTASPVRFQAVQRPPDFLAHHRRQALGGLVQDQQARIGQQRAADGQHLLLAAGQVAAQVAGAFGQPGNSA